MPCFCYVPADVARARFNVGIPVLMPPPLSLRMVAAFPALMGDPRLDVQINTGFEPMRLPNLVLPSGGLASIAMAISCNVGTFAFDDIPMLEMQLEQVAASLTRNIWPYLGWLTTFKMQPLLNMSLIARLVIDLQAMGLDPMTLAMPPAAPAINSLRLNVSPPKLAMAKLVAGLPRLVTMMEALNLPPLGETGAVPALNNRLQALATVPVPRLSIPYPMLLKLALVLESLATIQEAFGAVSPATFQMIDSMMRMWTTFPLTIPMEALTLADKLKLLPLMDDIRLGEEIAGRAGATMAMPFSPPKLAIAPFLNIVAALQPALTMAIDLPVFDQCAACNCA